MDLSEIVGETPKINILLSYLIINISKAAKIEKSKAAWNMAVPTMKSGTTGSMKVRTCI